MNSIASFPEPATYFPPGNGRYDVTPGLFRLNTNFGNGAMDARLFQLDNQFSRYQANKSACRAERLSKYFCTADFTPETEEAVCRLLIVRLLTEYPALFGLEPETDGSARLHCTLTGETLLFGTGLRLLPGPYPYVSAFDALCSQVMEDCAVQVQSSTTEGEESNPALQPATGVDRVCALHLCAPSHWAAEDKIGKNFNATHAPVPHFAKIAAASRALMETVIQRGPYVRFTWGIAFDDRLNAHPDAPPYLPTLAEAKAAFRQGESSLFLRVERQVLWGIPDTSAFLFTIRVYLYDVRDVCRDREKQTALVAALRSMSPDARSYKSVADDFGTIEAYLLTGSLASVPT